MAKIYGPLKEMKSNSGRRRELKKFLNGLEKRNIKGADSLAKQINDEAFKSIDCLKCANCCKTMAPTFKKSEVQRIAAHVGMTYDAYFKKYLKVDKEGDIMNKHTPCQHLGADNKCTVYEIRPKDCSGFPHTHKRDFVEFIPETHVQNVDYCPATYYIVDKMFQRLNGPAGVVSKVVR